MKRVVIMIAIVLIVVSVTSVVLVTRAHAAPQQQAYLVVAAPPRDAPLSVYEKLLNEKAAQGWQFDNWLYRGSVQTPDLIFKRK